MTHGSNAARVIGVEGLSRVEGEGSLRVEVRNGAVTDVALEIFEPPRYFEALLVGRHFTEAPDITARICGICPVAYQMSACSAMEDACGVTVDEEIGRLRRLLYCGEWIQSHALHIYLLHAPDFLGCADAVELAQIDRSAVERGLRIKRTGNLVMETVGGRAVHPVNVRVGGFYRAPDPASVAALKEPLRRARDDALATVAWVAGFDFPDVSGDYRFVALRDGDRYAIERGRPASSEGLDVSPAELADLVVEEHVARSTALHARLAGRDPYLTGPLARYALNAGTLPASAADAAAGAGLGPVVDNPFRSIVVRAVELVVRLRGGLDAGRVLHPAPARRGPGGATSGLRHRCDRGPSGPALPPVRDRRLGHDPLGPHRAAHLAEPAHHRGGPASRGPGGARARRRRAALALRAVGPQPRSLHLVRSPLPRRDGGGVVTGDASSTAAETPPVRAPFRVVVAGMGNEYRRDDGAGPAVAAASAKEAPATIDIGPVVDPLDLLGRWDGADLAIVVDALRSGGPRARSRCST